jgi:hypothetical protein
MRGGQGFESPQLHPNQTGPDHDQGICGCNAVIPASGTSKVIDALAWSLETALEAMRTATPKDDARPGLPSEPPRSEGRPADRQGPVPPLHPVVLPTGWHVACTGVVLREVSRTGRAGD